MMTPTTAVAFDARVLEQMGAVIGKGYAGDDFDKRYGSTYCSVGSFLCMKSCHRCGLCLGCGRPKGDEKRTRQTADGTGCRQCMPKQGQVEAVAYI